MVTSPRTHLAIDPALCGRPLELSPGTARVELLTTRVMVADDRGLVHGGFVFGLADYAAMLAVDDPWVVLGSASVKFSRPVRCGDTIVATAQVREREGRKHMVAVSVAHGDEEVFSGSFKCFVLQQHVLAGRLNDRDAAEPEG